jgi:hypothetical protein
MTLTSASVVVGLAAISGACASGGDDSGHKPTRQSLDYVTLSDGKNFSIRTSLLCLPDGPRTVEVRAVAEPKGRAFCLGAALWQTPLGRVDYTPRGSYYALVKVRKQRIFVFCLWSSRHYTINGDTGQVIKQGTGDNALLEYEELTPLRVVVVRPQAGRTITEQELEELENRDADKRRPIPAAEAK